MNLEIVITLIILAVLLSFILAFPIISFLYKFKIQRNLDVDFSVLIESRKNKVGTPIMGGLIIILTVVILKLILNFNEVTAIPIILFISLALIGGLDDVLNLFGQKRKIRTLNRVIKLIKVHRNNLYRIKLFLGLPWITFHRIMRIFESNPGKGLFAHERLLLQLANAVAFCIWFMTTHEDPYLIALPFFGMISIGILIIPLIVGIILGMINAVNFSDGLDGLSAGMLVNAFVGFLIIAFFDNNVPIALLSATIVGGLTTYLYFNIPPARVQMGDVGTYSLGGLLAFIGIMLQNPFVLFIICFPFVVEVSSTVIQSAVRKLFGRRLFKMAPLHHHFEMMGWSEEKVVMRFWLFSSLFTLLGIWVYFW
ncbi:MAG TPA: phospho-N-acetylmuramoyl-pentapeptide-transferase [Candidatus Dojkabacteria bacterium]|nr:phospho-N-acetylmuramoyl-pentapeptide-transferase [Candidatus Dojkabacteria bacterium]